jgi:hypothetical protein
LWEALVRLFGFRPRREIDSYPAIDKERWEALYQWLGRATDG